MSYILTGEEALAIAKGFVEETVLGGGAVKGKNIYVKNKEEVTSPEGEVTGINLTVGYTLDNGQEKEEVIFLPAGPKGKDGDPGDPGDRGDPGKSAYELAVEQGFEGTLEEWIHSLKDNLVMATDAEIQQIIDGIDDLL